MNTHTGPKENTVNTTSQTIENDSTETDEPVDVPCYCFVVDKPENTSSCKMTSRCGNASGAVSELMASTRPK